MWLSGALALSSGLSFPVPWLPQEEEDLPYEEEIMRNQFSVKCWLRYIEFKQGAPKPRLNQLYERALKLLPCRWERSQPPCPAPHPTPPNLAVTELASRSQVMAVVRALSVRPLTAQHTFPGVLARAPQC